MSRALVLSGGGPVGIAWETGIVAGLASGGVDVGQADLIVGTSAGSVVGARIALGVDMTEAAERYAGGGLFGEGTPGSEPSGSQQRQGAPEMTGFMQAIAELFTSDAPPTERRKKIGAFALEAQTPPEDAFVNNIASLLGPQDGGWPSRYVCTAVNAHTGEFVDWKESRSADLGRAVASSCAVPGIFPPITIGDARYIDGGMRSLTNADLATGHDSVVVISLIGGDRAGMFAPVMETTNGEIKELEEAGASVALIAPDVTAAEAMGLNLMDPSIAPQAAREGLRQGEAVARDLAILWE